MSKNAVAILLILGLYIWLTKKRVKAQSAPRRLPQPPEKPKIKNPAQQPGPRRNLNGFLAALRQRESNNNYGARRRNKNGRLSQYWGAYQLGTAARKDINENASWEDFKNSPAIQDAAARRWVKILRRRVNGRKVIRDAIKAGTVRGETFDESRAVAMVHHTGLAALGRWISGGERAKDGLGTRTVEFTRGLENFNLKEPSV